MIGIAIIAAAVLALLTYWLFAARGIAKSMTEYDDE